MAVGFELEPFLSLVGIGRTRAANEELPTSSEMQHPKGGSALRGTTAGREGLCLFISCRFLGCDDSTTMLWPVGRLRDGKLKIFMVWSRRITVANSGQASYSVSMTYLRAKKRSARQLRRHEAERTIIVGLRPRRLDLIDRPH